MASNNAIRRVKIKKSRSAVVLNGLPQKYSSINDLYELDEKKSRHRGIRSGILVTILIPPVAQSHKYPNFLNDVTGQPFISANDRNKIFKRFKAYKKSRRSALKELRRKTKALEAAKKRAASTARTKQIARLQRRIDALNVSLAADQGSLLARHSTRFDITDFVTSLSWSSNDEQSSIELSLAVDNSGGIFNYLPVGVGVTVWRRKSLKNFDSTGFDPSTEHFEGRWHPYMKTHLASKERSAEGRSQTMDLLCWDRMAYFAANKVKKKVYKKDKTHPKGWSPREITIDLCKRHSVPYNAARIPKYIIQPGTKGNLKGVEWPRLTKLEQEEPSIAQYLTAAWKQSYNKLPQKHRRDWAYHTRTGILEVEIINPPGKQQTNQDFNIQRRIPVYEDGATIESGSLSEKLTDEVFTVLHAKGTYSTTRTNPNTGRTEKQQKKLKGTFKANQTTRIAFGEKETTKNFKKQKFANKKEFTTFCKEWIDGKSRPINELHIKGKGTLGLWPLRYVYVSSRHFGARGYFQIKSVSYTVQDGYIDVDLVLNVYRRAFVLGHKFYGKHQVGDFNLNRWY